MITIRGHHLLCIHGFKGMGYSESFVKEMEKIVTLLREEPNNPMLEVKVVKQLDDVCQGCPNNGKSHCLSDENHVTQMDQRVIKQLGIEAGHIYTKHELLLATQQKVEPSDLDYICEGCSWLSYGVCKEGIQLLKQKEFGGNHYVKTNL